MGNASSTTLTRDNANGSASQYHEVWRQVAETARIGVLEEMRKAFTV